MNWLLTDKDYLPGYRTLLGVVLFETAVVLVALLAPIETQIMISLALFAPFVIFLLPHYPQIGFPFMIIVTGLHVFTIVGDPEHVDVMHLTWFHMVLIVTWISAATNFILEGRRRIPSTSFGLPLIIYFVVVAVSLFFTPNFEDGIIETIRLLALSTVFFLSIVFFETKKSVYLVIVPLVLVPLGVGILTIWQLFTQGSFFTPLVAQVAGSLGFHIYRAMGTFTNPNELGTFLMLGVIVSFGLLFIKSLSRFWKIALVIVFILNGVGIVGSFSRAGWLSALAGCFFIVVLNKKFKYLFLFALLCAFFVAVLIFFTPFSDYVLFRFITIFNPTKDPSSQARICLVISAWWMFLDNPILGVGFRGFPKLAFDYIHPNMPQILAGVNEAHTLPAEIIAELGIVGIMVTTWIFVVIVREALLAIREIKDEFLAEFEIIFFSLFLAFMVNFLFATDLVNNMFWIVIGMIFAIRRIPKYSPV